MTAVVTPRTPSSEASPIDTTGSISNRRRIELETTDLLSDPDWDRTIMSHRSATVFHTEAWARVLNKTYGHTPLGLRFSEASEAVALLPMMEVDSSITGRRGVSMPFSDFCEPLTFGQFNSGLLLQKLLELARERNWRYFELRGGRPALPAEAVASEGYYGHQLDLTIGLEKLFARFSASARRAIRKAQQSGLSVEASDTAQGTNDFYQLHVKTRKRHGVPPQPFSFFRNIWREILQRNLGFIVLAKRGSTPIAAAIFFNLKNNMALFKFGASDQKLQGLRGNNLVMWEGIQQLVRLGARSLHFGRTAFNNNGLRRFKLSWGTEEEPVEYFKFAVRSQTWLTARPIGPEFANQVFRRLPSSLNRFAGALIYPHLD